MMVACGPACRYNTPDGCTAAANGHKCPLSNMVVETAKPRQTNADRVRAMIDDRLKYVILCPLEFSGLVECPDVPNCTTCKQYWLQQPAEVE